MKGIEQLTDCMLTILAEVQELRSEVKAARLQEDMTRPFTAEEMCERWHITGPTKEHQLRYLARRCRDMGLAHLKGRDGWNALYRRADVVRAEEHGAGKIRGRKTHGRRKAA